MRLSSVVLLEGGDADALAEGEEITLKNWGNVKISKIDKGDDGEFRVVFNKHRWNDAALCGYLLSYVHVKACDEHPFWTRLILLRGRLIS